MSHASKSKAKGINASSFFDLKAELSKQEAEFLKAKATGSVKPIVGGVKRPDKVCSVPTSLPNGMLIFALLLRNLPYGLARTKE